MAALAFDVVGVGSRTVAFLHGILGSRNNWRSFAQKLVDARPDVRAVLVDLRCHGESHGASPPHTIDACAADIDDSGLHVDVLIGHSFGGKVALAYARDHADVNAWILDAPPGPRTFAGISDVERVLAAVQSVPLPVAGRRELVATLLARGLSRPLADWMTTNLRPAQKDDHSAGFVWKFDLDAIPALLQSFGEADLWGVVEDPRRHVHLVKAARSERFTASDVARAERSPARFHVLDDAGHWLHTDNPTGLLSLFLREGP